MGQRDRSIRRRGSFAPAGRRNAELFERAPDAYVITDSEAVVIAANQAAVKLLAAPRSSLVGTPLGLFVSSADQPALQDLLKRLKQTDETQEWDILLRSAGGKSFDASITIAPAYNPNGTVAALYWLIRDMSRRRLSEQALRKAHDELDAKIRQQNLELAKANEELRAEVLERSKAEGKVRQQNEFLNHVLESLPHPFYVLDAADYTVKMANSAAALGEPREGTTCYALTHRRSLPCDGSEHACPLQMVKNTKKPVIVEHIHFDREGRPRNVEVHGYPIFDEQGNVVQLIEYSLDITERKRLEAELLNNAEKIKMFAYAISHDLRSPLIGIHGLIELLHRQYRHLLDEKGRKYCEQILKASRQVVELIGELNVFIKTKEAPFDFEMVNPQEILRTIRDEFNPLLAMRGIEWSAPDRLPSLKADKLSLLRVFRNLVDNALKYGGKELSEIRIAYREGEGHHVFSVSDDGVGIKREDCESIFGLFQRNQTSRGVEGTGLGLAIVKEIATKHGGAVWAEPNADRGVTFHVSLSKSL